MHSLACSQNKGLSEHPKESELAVYRPHHLPEAEASIQQSEPEGEGLLQSQPQRLASPTKL